MAAIRPLDGPGPAHRPRRPGVHRQAPERTRRPPPPAQGVRSHQRDPGRLGQRARAQPGAAAVRPPRPAPADDARRRHRRRRAVRVLGPRRGDRPEQPAPAVPLEDGVRSRVEGDRSHRGREARVRRGGQGPHPRQRTDHRRRPRAAGRQEGQLVELGRRQARPRAPLPPRRGRRRAPAARLRPPVRPARAGAAGERAGCADADRGRGAQGAAGRSPPAAWAWRRSRTSPTTTARAHDLRRVEPLGRRARRGGRAAAGRPSRGGRSRRTSTATRRCRGRSTPGPCSARSTRSCGTASAPSGCSTSSTGSRSTCRRRSGSTATTRSRTCSATASSAAST